MKILFTLLIGALVMTSCALSSDARRQPKFTNSEVSIRNDVGTLWQITRAYFQDQRLAATPTQPIPLQPIVPQELERSEARVYRLGHSTVLMQLDGKWLLTDPVFSERASPVQWAGPKRFHDSPLALADLPEITAVVISHDHYDHLDKAAIQALDAKVNWFVTPLKVGNHLRQWGIDDDKIIELDWWQQTVIEGLTLTATPSQHFSGRGLLDRDRTLWASWVVAGADTRVFFSGDSGYFSGFKEIGDRLGPFDLTLIETGAYNDLWSEVHMLPEESLQAHRDLRGKVMLPIHNGTFDLALHDWFEPLQRIQQLARQHGVTLATPIFGEAVPLQREFVSQSWWPAPSVETEFAQATP
ncbi:MBL fold metallo-hydrolase [Ferrimonas sp. SCSIO 43195]|nr:MBL fold metallo-hydrolase [Ferrimonas sp. SCSIO 43195]